MLCAKLLQSCLTLCHPMDCSPPGSSVHGILQARILEWVAMPLSPRVCSKSCPTLCDPMDCSLPCSFVHGIFQAIVLEWAAISFSRGIFLTQGSNLGLLHCRQTLYPLSHQGAHIRPNKSKSAFEQYPQVIPIQFDVGEVMICLSSCAG